MARKKKSKKTVDAKISEALDIATPATDQPIAKAEPIEGEVVDSSILVAENQPLAGIGYPTEGENPDIEEDYQKVRKHLHDVRDQAADALDKMKEVAEQGEQARMYEVVGQLIKANLEVADAEIKLHKDMKQLREQEPGKAQRAAHIGDVNQSIFVGTTKDLQDLQKSGKLPPAEDSK